MFEVTGQQVRFSECNKEGKLSIRGVVDYFQDCSNSQSEELGVGMRYLEKIQKAWIIDFWQIVINRRPDTFEDIKTSTWAHGFKGFFGLRNFVMKTAKDEILAYANSYWVYIDMVTGRPQKVTDEVVGAYKSEESLDMEYAGRKLEIPLELELVGEDVVKQHNLDIYNHMNNGKYIELAVDYLPNDDIRQIRCQYKKQARLGDKIFVYRHIEDELITIVLKGLEDVVYTVLCFDMNK